MVVIPDGVDPVVRQRVEWGQNLAAAIDGRFTRKELLKAIEQTYGLSYTLQALSLWLRGAQKPHPEAQAALAGILHMPHHLLFPPIQLQRKSA